MIRFILLLLLCPFLINASDFNELQLINGEWKCETNYQGDYIQTKVVSLTSYNVEQKTYVFKGTVIFTAKDSPLKTSVESSSNGAFSYSDSKLTSKPHDVQVKLVEDQIGMLTPEAIMGLKTEMENSESQQYITKELTTDYWSRFNPKDSDLIECNKIKSAPVN
jgi:hypothetical protein